MKRKICSALLCILLIVATLTGCGSTGNGTATATTATPATAATATAQTANAGTPPDGAPPSGGQGAPGGGPGGGSSESSVTLKGAYVADGSTQTSAITYNGKTDGSTLASTTAGENVVLAQNLAKLELSNVTLQKSGDDENGDETDFYAVNAVVAAKSGSTVYAHDLFIASNGRGANNLFASGTGTDSSGATVPSTIYAYNVTIASTKNNSRGLDATLGGVIVGANLKISTQGDHCAGIATDRGGGSISVNDSTISTAGQGSPILYSTGTIEVNNINGTATGSQTVGMEGLNTIRIVNSTLASTSNAQDDVNNGVIIYQSMSGDASSGKAVFEASNSTLKTSINGPKDSSQVDSAMFYVTNTSAEIVLNKTTLDFNTQTNKLLVARGNNHNNWGASGSNGGKVTFTAIDQTLAGDISCDGISSVDFFLTGASTYSGKIIASTEYKGDGGTTLSMAAGTVWTVTGDSTLVALNQPSGAKILDASGSTVTIKGTDGTVYATGTSRYTVTVGSYSTQDNSAAAGAISAATVDRTAFNTYYNIQ